jgi:hypothetical protein
LLSVLVLVAAAVVVRKIQQLAKVVGVLVVLVGRGIDKWWQHQK